MASPLQDLRSTSAESTTEVVSFLTDPAEFGNDPRISWSKPDSCWILEREDGEEFHFDAARKKWVLEVDPELIRQQQSAYLYHGVEENDTEVPHPRELRARRKAERAAAPKPKKARVNTAVFVSKLPLDADKEEIRQLFAKYGVIAEEISNGEPKIKMYKDQDGKFIGEALVVYFRPESILLATQMLDETEFRFGVTAPGGPMRVEAADDSYRKNKSEAADRPKHTASEKRKIMDRIEALNSKLADWDDDAPPPERKFTRAEHNLVLKHMFDKDELAADPTDMIDISMEIRVECEKFGEVTKVTLWDEEPEGVVTVRFKDPKDAIACMEKLQGRYFDKKAVEASISKSRQRFRKSGHRHGDDSDFSEGELERLDRFGDWLERDEPKAKKAKTEDVRATELETKELGADKLEIDGL
ncbi:unnamed protein product [Penicillium salamii]|uniref:RRM domain-containing protein n=1 Tax=Penicillium salamii TaxID=1612424 RepID=A0A9W4NKN4_9EURO|nr:unnamed protein product [Penicillium salamii]CAG8362199.1 unnamed protein product [Penicillium salamii]CAG8369137.1 unnamed protein product [Penicillium salamii]CAG8390823.1 unnamed protein product [Penicillium salamii]